MCVCDAGDASYSHSVLFGASFASQTIFERYSAFRFSLLYASVSATSYSVVDGT